MKYSVEVHQRLSPGRTAGLVTGVYIVFGSLWIFVSDRAVQRISATQPELTAFQSVKGQLFILVSGGLIFGLVYYAQAQLQRRNRRLETSKRHAQLLHRILRHDLRNTCNVILGNVKLLNEITDRGCDDRLQTLQTQTNQLLELSRKSLYIREFLDISETDIMAIDIVESARTQAQIARKNHPEATIKVTAPASASVMAHYRIKQALEELITNAIKHHPGDAPSVWVDVTDGEETVAVTVADDGDGLPRLERRVMLSREESPTEHSQGLGLWLVRLAVEHSNGSLTADETDEGGAAITMSLPAA